MTAVQDVGLVTARRASVAPWWAFVALLLAGWGWLIVGHLSGHHDHASFAPVAAMWTLMTATMMASTAVPVLIALWHVLARTSSAPWWMFVAGYLMIWAVFAVGAAAAQLWLIELRLVGHDGSSASLALSALLLAAAGIYQLSSLKQRCLTECITPMTFFIRSWRDGNVGGLRMGLRHGLTCVGCCWALMLLAFVGGVANIWFMVLSAVIMALEKLPAIGRRMTMPLGIALLVASAAVLLVVPNHGTSPATPHQHASGVIERATA